jgi:8-oxo-dGTP pyrophosphatase MutT (NUDIX family)
MTEPFDAAADLADAPRTSARLRPKDAATLIVIRRDKGEPRILMGRRAAGLVFMAGKWVFPGGRVDPRDGRTVVASPLPPVTAALLSRETGSARARALGVAAVRELAEETGLRLSDQKGRPELDALAYVARAITPPGRSRRFDTRFFTADADRLAGLEPTPIADELDAVDWFTPDQARELDLPAITRFVLGEVEARLATPHRALPFVRMVRGRHLIERIEVSE